MIYEEVLKTIEKNNLINKGDKIVVGLSGGPDSVFMLHILYRMSKEYDLTIYAAHLNHQLRGLEAHLDALYVKNLCEKLEIPCFIKSVNVKKYCDDNKIGIEEGARRIRYNLFNEIKTKLGANKIAIGHNLNDQAETVLMKLIRGTGLRGLRGIEYQRKDGIIRPILDIKRKDIEEYCKEQDLRPRIDNSNLEPIYSRNKIRLKIIPYFEKEFNENVVESIVRMSNNIKMDFDYIDSQVNKAFDISCKKYTDGVYIFMKHFKDFHDSIKSRLIIKSIKEVLGDVRMIDKKHIDDVMELLPDDKKNKRINLPRGIFVYRYIDYILITKKEINIEDIEYEYNVAIGRNLYISEIGKTFYSRIKSYEQFVKEGIKPGYQYIDVSKIKGNITLRNRRQGDKIRLLGGTKKVKELFIGVKIPKEERSFIPLLENSGEILCVCGYRINVDYKVDENTKQILEFRLE